MWESYVGYRCCPGGPSVCGNVNCERLISRGCKALDTVPPNVDITHQPSSPTVTQDITFTATASDNYGLKSIFIYVDNLNVKTCDLTNLPTSATCQFSSR